MKKILGSTKGAVALALIVALSGVTAYGADTKSGTEAVTAQLEQTVPVLTYKEALEKAKKHSVDLRDLEKKTDYLQDTKSDLWDDVGSFSTPTYDYQQWVDSAVYAYSSALYNADSRLTTNKYKTQITNLMLETTLKSTFSSIVQNEDNLKSLKESSEIQKILYEQGQKKFDLGMLSQYKLDQLKAEYEGSKTKVYQLEKTLEQMYASLNDLMGESVDKAYTVEYNLEFEPYVLAVSMESFINASINSDYSILMQAQAVEDAKFTQNYLSELDDSSNKSKKYSYESAQRALKAAKEDKAIAIRNAYVALQKEEADYNQAKTDLAQAQADLKTAEVNYKVGNSTELALKQSQLAVTQKELALEKIVYSYDMQVFAFKNSSLISSGSAASQES